MRILLIEPEKRPVIREIDGSLKSMQEAVGGYIQAIYPFEDPVALVCGDEAKLQGLPLNRALYERGSRVPYDIIAGTFFVCGVGDENFTSLTDEQIQTIYGTLCHAGAVSEPERAYHRGARQVHRLSRICQ